MFRATLNQRLLDVKSRSISSAIPFRHIAHRAAFKTYFERKPTWKDESRATKALTYVASATAVSLGFAYCYYRIPTEHPNSSTSTNRKQLDILPHQIVDGYLQLQVDLKLREFGIPSIGVYTRAPYVYTEHPDSKLMEVVFSGLIGMNKLECYRLKTFYMDSPHYMESALNSHPRIILVYGGETLAAATTYGIAAMLASRIARKTLYHDAEQVNHTVFTCLAAVPALLFGVVARNSGLGRRVAIPYLLAYISRIIWQLNGGPRNLQAGEEDEYAVELLKNSAIEIHEAVEYRKRQIAEGEKAFEFTRKFYADGREQAPMQGHWMACDNWVREQLSIRPIKKFLRKQRRHLANMLRMEREQEIAGGIREASST